SSFCIVTRRPRDLRSRPREEAVRPLPKELATPPVTKMCLVTELQPTAPSPRIRGMRRSPVSLPRSLSPRIVLSRRFSPWFVAPCATNHGENGSGGENGRGSAQAGALGGGGGEELGGVLACDLAVGLARQHARQLDDAVVADRRLGLRVGGAA